MNKVPDGHFYSPIPDLSYVLKNKDRIFSRGNKMEGIKLCEISQRHLLYSFEKFSKDIKFERYYEPNDTFPIGDAVILQAMIRHFNPKQIIEVGCGMSSAAMLDTREFFNLNTEIFFVEPNPHNLYKIMKPGDKKCVYDCMLQDTEYEDLFGDLKEGDIAFFDSSHVSKVGSEVHDIFFKILPILKPGVIIHFHDVFFPFEYPLGWVEDGIYWNEAYLLRAFLMNNPNYEILYWNNYMGIYNKELVSEILPLCEKHFGASIWLKKN